MGVTYPRDSFSRMNASVLHFIKMRRPPALPEQRWKEVSTTQITLYPHCQQIVKAGIWIVNITGQPVK